MAIFIAIVRSDGSAGYTASFPDFSGLAVDATSVDVLLAKARGALAAHIESLLDATQTIGAPIPVDAIVRNDALFLAGIEIPDDLRITHIDVAVPALALVRIDAFAQRRGLTRSVLFAAAIERWEAEENLSGAGGGENGPTMFDLGNPLEMRVEVIAAAVEPLSPAEPERRAEEETKGDSNTNDITAELERLLEETTKPQPAEADDGRKNQPEG